MADIRIPMWRAQPMQQQKTGPVVPPVAPVPAENEGAKPEDDSEKPLGEGGERALRAERKRASDAEKRAVELEARVKEFEDKGKTDEQKRAENDAKLAGERDTATVKALRYEVCEEMDLPLKAARFLTGATKAEIEEAARAFKEIGVTAPPAKTGLPPSPNAHRETQKPNASAAGLAEAQKRFGKPA